MLTCPATYIRTNMWHTTLYVGSTDNLLRRDEQHRARQKKGSFSARHNLVKLVWFKLYESVQDAFKEEQRIKGGSRHNKIKLIEDLNPQWADLKDKLFDKAPFEGIASSIQNEHQSVKP